MTTLLLVLMAALFIAALERTHRRQGPKPPGLHGTYDRDDRDWARTQLDVLARKGESGWDSALQLGSRHGRDQEGLAGMHLKGAQIVGKLDSCHGVGDRQARQLDCSHL
ncbi:MAG TPA: hypothetical protein VES02_11805 [Dermatophilaceae bacterium]|nr:hypothetical protein [Dermatophilaceae bacterium]